MTVDPLNFSFFIVDILFVQVQMHWLSHVKECSYYQMSFV